MKTAIFLIALGDCCLGFLNLVAGHLKLGWLLMGCAFLLSFALEEKE